MGRTPSEPDEPSSRSGKRPDPSAAAPERHNAAVVADRFDRITWRDTYEQSAGLRELAEELNERHAYATDLLTDAFLAAYKVRPRVREREEMDPTRLVNHQVISSLVESPEFAGLHRETAGDPYAAAMAVLAQAAALRRILERSRDARERAEEAKKARQDAEGAAAAAGEALQRAAGESGEGGEDGEDDAGGEDGTAADPAADAAR
ncbi:hypothetical protein ACWEHL_32385, partial [Streptomyces sp. NPDC004726]